MNVRVRNQAEWILQAAALGMLCVPWVFYNSEWGWWDYYYPFVSSLFRYPLRSFSYDPVRYVFRWILFIMVCVSFVLYLMQRFSGKRSDFKGFAGCLPLSAAELILFFVLERNTFQGSYRTYMFLIAAALTVALALVTWIGYFRAMKLGVADVPSRWKHAGSGKQSASPTTQVSADELRKYAELLDAGAITQEEFDQIKRQMLGL